MSDAHAEWPSGHGLQPSRSILIALLIAAGLLMVATAWILLTSLRPSYDAFGWLTWGRQVLHWNLNTDGAPSWKPLTFLFTLPYALAGANPQVWLWMITATATSLGSVVFGARIAYRLTGPSHARRWGPFIAAAFAGVSVLGFNGYLQQLQIANSDPMIVTLCLAAIDCHLSRRYRWAFSLLVLVSLGRPEGWLFAALYAIWTWRAEPSMRVLAAAGALLVPLAWFVVPALTSHSWFISGDLALNSANVIHGSKIIGVINRLRSLYELPMQVAVLCALALAVARRDARMLALGGAAVLWVVVEIVFAYHGWSAVPRYLLEPAAVLVVIVGAGVGQLLASEPPLGTGRVSRWLLVVPVLVLVIALIPAAHSRARLVRTEARIGRHAATELSRLEAVIAREGGAAAVKRCGQPVTLLGYQSELAWAIGLNVGNVGFRPGKSISQGLPIVLFKPHDQGWQVRPIHIGAAKAGQCAKLRTDTRFGTGG